ncbi:hypothetical protein V5O48_001046 [Marasmius crinis-equi]|uniref:Uncharacterized protein n=1 Tax=Marasmius crinis-equi TaxID=585013 RepID=A0ABR3FZF8_9AGAR
MRGTDNLRDYVHEAILPKMVPHASAPPMPPPNHKSHLNNLRVRAESWRRLQCMYSFGYDIDQIISQYNAACPPGADINVPRLPLEEDDEDPSSGVCLSVPCPNAARFEIPLQREARPDNISRLFKWIDTFPLATVQRIMHLINPERQRWRFYASEDCTLSGDRKIFQHFLWSLPEDDFTSAGPEDQRLVEDAQGRQVVVAFQPPWILSPQDMKEFVGCRSFPTFRAPGHFYPTELNSEERVWAKLWDLCVTRNTHWFVLTSYDQWVFGVFSDRWTSAYTTPIYESNASFPTIIETLAFWTASAMGIHNLFPYPKVPEPVHLPPLPQHIDEADVGDAAISESAWSAGDSDTVISAQVRDLTPNPSEDGLSDETVAPAYAGSTGASPELVREWMAATYGKGFYDPEVSSGYVSRWEKNRFAYQDTPGGEWLITNTRC